MSSLISIYYYLNVLLKFVFPWTTFVVKCLSLILPVSIGIIPYT